jgi:O-antigen ligase
MAPLAKWITIVVVLGLALTAGAVLDLTILIAVLGLFNVAVALFLLLRKDIIWGFVFYLTCDIFFQTGFWIRLPAFPDLYPARIASTLLFLIFIVQVATGLRSAPKFGRLERTMLIFLVVMLISIVTSGQKRWLMLMRGYLYPFIFFYFARTTVRTTNQMRIVFTYLALVGIYFAVMGVFEHLKWYGLVWPKFIVDPTVRDIGLARLGYRVRGIFLQPAVLGCVMAMGFFPAWHYLSHVKGIVPLVIRLILLVTTPLTIFFTQTRSVYLGFAMALVTAGLTSRRLRPLSVGLVLAAATAAFINWDNLGGEDREKGGLATMNTVNYRVALIYETGESFLDHPFFGVGFMNFEEALKEYRRPRDVPFFGHIDLGVGSRAVSHNILVTIVAEQGLLGLIPYLLIIVFILLRCRTVFRDLPSKGLISKDYVVCVWCAIAAYFTNAMFLELRYFEYVNVLFYFIVGAMIGLHEEGLKEGRIARHEEQARAKASPAPAMAIPLGGPA